VRELIRPIFALVLLSSFAATANATKIDYTLDHLSGNTYQYNYTFVNDTLGFDLDAFSVYFDVALYENLAVTASPADWDSIVIQPDTGLPADGLFDTLALGLLLAPGDSLGVFSASFDWLGGSVGPGDQFFELYDVNFDLIDSGMTTLAGGSQTVPEPSSILVLFLGLVLLNRRLQRRAGC